MIIRKSNAFIMIFLTISIAAYSQCGRGQPTAYDNGLDFHHTIVMAELDNPWDIAFAPNGAMFFTEKCRGLSVRTPEGKVNFLFGISGASMEAGDFFCQGQSGMLGTALDPDFVENRQIYVYMSSDKDNVKTNRVIRLTVDKYHEIISSRNDIVTDIPFKESRNRWGGAGAHSGGRLRFSPYDGFLYVTSGDNHNGPLPQDLTRLGGKVLRIDRDGNAAPDNNLPPEGDARIYAYGFRNVQGIDFHPETGRPFISEHGPAHNDEVTPLTAGGNGGWDPAPLMDVSCAAGYCGYTSNKPDGTPTPMTDFERFPDALRPSWTNNGASEGMGPCVFLEGKNWKNYEGWLAVGFLRGARIELLKLDSKGMTIETAVIAGLPAKRIRSLVSGPDNAIYVAIDEGEIWRLEKKL